VFNELWDAIKSNYPQLKVADNSIDVEELVAFIEGDIDTYSGYAKQFSRLARKNILGILPSIKHVFMDLCLGPIVILVRKMYILGIIELATFYYVFSSLMGSADVNTTDDELEVIALIISYIIMIPFYFLKPIFYYAKFKRVLKKISLITDKTKRIEVIRKKGGVNILMVLIGIALFFISIITGV
jgi:hypothetical protein